MNWNFNASEYEEKSFEILPKGDYRVRIEECNEKKSSKGNDMFEIVFSVSGKSQKLWYYIPFMPDNAKITNQKLGEMFESFGIPNGNLNPAEWVGKVGALRVKHEPDNNGTMQAKVHYPLNKKQQATLSAWVEPTLHTSSTPQNTPPQNYYGTPPEPQSNVPFDTNLLI